MNLEISRPQTTYRVLAANRARLAPRWEGSIFAACIAVLLVHLVDATTIHWQSGASAGERGVQLVLAVAAPLLLAVAYPYLGVGWRSAIAFCVGLSALAAGVVIHVIGAVKNGFGSGDVTGFLLLPVGATLLVLAVATLFRGLPNWRWRIAVAPLAVVVLWSVVVPAFAGAYAAHAPRYVISPADLGRPYEDVSFETRDGLAIRGWYVPSENGAAVIVLHGSGGARIRPVDHARMLLDHGYGVLLMDSRGHGESEGATNALGWGAWPDVEAAAEFLNTRDDVKDGRVGVLGLSMGAEVGLDAASHVSSIRALVADGGGVRSINEVRSFPLTWRRALEYPAYTVNNAVVAVLSGEAPPTAIADRAPHIETPTLLISSKVIEERDLNRIWYERLAGEAELWELPDTAHTGGLRTHPEAYEARVVEFLDTYLRP